LRTIDPERPARVGHHDGLAYALWLPDDPPRGAVVVLHGADSTKERHFGFAQACHANGFAALAFDARGHGQSDAPLGGSALDDVATMAGLLRDAVPAGTNLALRGSSMGGYFAICGAADAAADAVIAICPAPAELLLRGLESRFAFPADTTSLRALLRAHDLQAATAALRVPVLLMHATGDESVPVEHSRDLAAAGPDVRYVEIRGGHHSSVQHDPELVGDSLAWLGRRFAPGLD
jgi:non-heme chloroperoxidase